MFSCKSNAKVITNSKNLVTSLAEIRIFSDFITFVSRKRSEVTEKKLHDILGNAEVMRE